MKIDLRSKGAKAGLAAIGLACLCGLRIDAQTNSPTFKVIAFYTGIGDKAHISFVKEANRWFSRVAVERGFTYNSTTNWANLNLEFLSTFQVVVFLDTRPEAPAQREAFETYMRK